MRFCFDVRTIPFRVNNPLGQKSCWKFTQEYSPARINKTLFFVHPLPFPLSSHITLRSEQTNSANKSENAGKAGDDTFYFPSPYTCLRLYLFPLFVPVVFERFWRIYIMYEKRLRSTYDADFSLRIYMFTFFRLIVLRV